MISMVELNLMQFAAKTSASDTQSFFADPQPLRRYRYRYLMCMDPGPVASSIAADIVTKA
jgi:hypothetical protein